MLFPWFRTRVNKPDIAKVLPSTANQISPNLLLPTRNFSIDIQALSFIIQHETTVTLYYLQKQLANVNIVRDDAIRVEANRLSIKIFDSLAEDYRNLLLLYYTKTALINFITQTVMLELCKLGIAKNKTTITGAMGGDPNVLINRTDI